MASITFFLKQPYLDRPTPIIARVAVGGSKIKVYTGLQIQPKKWIQAAQLVAPRGNAQAGHLNATLAAQRALLEAYLLDALAAGLVPTPEQLRQVLDPELVEAPAAEPAPVPMPEPPVSTPAPVPLPPVAVAPGPVVAVPESAPEVPVPTPAVEAEPATGPTAEPVVEPAAELAESTTPAAPDLLAAYVAWDEAQADRRSPRTRLSNRTTLQHLRAFQAATGHPVTFAGLGAVFAARFTSYLLATARLTDNSLAKVLTRLKAFLRDAQAQGLTPPQDLKYLNWTRREPAIVTLTAQEVARLERLELDEQPGQRNARDLFLLACYTGLRYSDLVSLRPEHWQGSMLRLTTQKTRETVTVPLRPAAQQLLRRLFAGELTFVSNQKLNAHLKLVGRQAGLLRVIERVRYAGGQRQVERFRQYELLTCHTARRTFVTLALEQHIRPETVMKVTGHKSYSTFKRYINISDSTVEREFAAVYGGAAAPR